MDSSVEDFEQSGRLSEFWATLSYRTRRYAIKFTKEKDKVSKWAKSACPPTKIYRDKLPDKVTSPLSTTPATQLSHFVAYFVVPQKPFLQGSYSCMGLSHLGVTEVVQFV